MGSNIYYGGSLDYNVSVYKIVERIRQNLVGQVIVSAVNYTGKDLFIRPYEESKLAKTSRCNAASDPDSSAAATALGLDVGLTSIHGTGRGSNVTIYFTPGLVSGRSCDAGKPGSEDDESLLHEMVHALRQMQGKGGGLFYNDEEEFLAVLVANVYISVKTNSNKGLRRDHNGNEPLLAPFNTSSGFLTDPANLKRMKIYSLVWQPAFSRLACVVGPRPFNPFYEYYVRNAQFLPKQFRECYY